MARQMGIDLQYVNEAHRELNLKRRSHKIKLDDLGAEPTEKQLNIEYCAQIQSAIEAAGHQCVVKRRSGEYCSEWGEIGFKCNEKKFFGLYNGSVEKPLMQFCIDDSTLHVWLYSPLATELTAECIDGWKNSKRYSTFTVSRCYSLE